MLIIFLTLQSSGCSDPGAEGTVVVHDVPERTDAGDHDSAAVADPATQRSVQHPQAEIRWASPRVVQLYGGASSSQK